MKNVYVEIDFGQGDITSFEETLTANSLSYTVGHIYESTNADDIVCRMYDRTSGNNTLISELILPVGEGITIDLDGRPNTVYVDEDVFFETTVTGPTNDYNYNYDFDDGTTDDNEPSEVSHSYDDEGTYLVFVEVEDEDGEVIGGDASTSITVLPPEDLVVEDDLEPIESNDTLIGVWTYVLDSRDIYTGEERKVAFAFEFAKNGSGIMARYTPPTGVSYITDTMNYQWEISDASTVAIMIEGAPEAIYFDISSMSSGKIYSSELDDNGERIVLEKQDFE